MRMVGPDWSLERRTKIEVGTGTCDTVGGGGL